MTITDSDTYTVVLEGLDFKPGCESGSHVKGTFGHLPEQTAGWVTFAPCGVSLLMCDGWVQTVLAGRWKWIACVCETAHPVEQFRIIPIDHD